MKQREDEKHIHDGHRARLIDLAVNAGLDAMSDVQRLEAFLTYIFPRGDVNPLAHRLLDKFGNFTQVVEAGIGELMSVKGINERSAKKISLFTDFFFEFSTAKMGKKFVVHCIADAIDAIEDILRFRNTEYMILLAVSAGSIVTHKRLINLDQTDQVGLPVAELTNFLATAQPSSFIVGHCHPYGRAFPSPADVNAFNLIQTICNSCGVNFVDSFIVGEDGVYSQKDEKLVRTYYDVDELKRVFKATIS